MKPNDELISHLFRLEYTKMTAVLCRRFGLQHIEVAEDIVSETFSIAVEEWALNGIPENPTAWLYNVAKNKTKDYLKRLAIFETQVREAINETNHQGEQDFEFTQEIIIDSQLAMIFAVCNPNNSTESQICLALQILCGFSVEQIANAFLSKTETIKKRLLRARANLRADNFQIKPLQETVIHERLDKVLSTIYLLFSEGYYSKSNNHLIRKDLCLEAIRLSLLLTQNKLTNTTKANALLALMCYQSSRLDARVTYDGGETILYEQQDKNLWDEELIDRGNYYLVNACSENEISKYHLEAGIAYWHTTSVGEDKWLHILELYNKLILIEYSLMTALNRTFALAKVYGNRQAVEEAEKLNLSENSYYHSLLGYLYTSIDVNKSIEHYKKAISLTKSIVERKTLQAYIDTYK